LTVPAAKSLSGSRKWLTKGFAQPCLPSFWLRLALIVARSQKIAFTSKAYDAVLLTMIKIVLIAAISFASPSP
jgi:hypothetical protein